MLDERFVVCRTHTTRGTDTRTHAMASRALVPGQLHVLLTLRDGERSFGMSLVQKTSALGLKYTVVSSVFANSPAHRAGVRTGCVGPASAA